MLHEYNQEVSEALKATLGSNLPNPRHQGIRIMKQMDDSLVTVWHNGMIDWRQTETGSCAKYQAWTGTDWDADAEAKYTAHVKDDVATHGLVPGAIVSGSEPSSFVCQFMGPNLALNKKTGGQVYSNLYPSEKAADGDW